MRPGLAMLLGVVLLLTGGAALLDASGAIGTGILRAAPSPSPAPTASPSPTPAGTTPPAPRPAGPVLPAVAAAAAGAASIAAVLGPLLEAPALGAVSAAVLDASGASLLERSGEILRTPASATKVATGIAALRALGGERTLRTRAVAGGAPGEVVLVGAGDATLTAAVSAGAVYPVRASLADLAAQVAAALRTAPPAAPLAVRVDDSLFTGPAVSPDWRANYVPEGTVAPVHALSVDQGRVDPARRQRVADPALLAGERFADLLREQGMDVAEGVTRALAPPAPASGAAAGAAGVELGAVESAPVSALVEQMLQASDNDLSEALGRLAALQAGDSADFAGAGRAATAVLREGAGASGEAAGTLLDGSGLAPGSRASAPALARMLAAAAADPELSPILSGLPIGGFSGTLAGRYVADGPDGAAAGFVRAKTGTLSGVSSLLGTVTDEDGPVLVFAILAGDTPNTVEARAALDDIAVALAACGCP